MIELEDVDFAYRLRGRSIPVLSGLTCAFERGTIAAIVGRSGSGKTSLLRLLSGLAAPGSGSIRIDGGPGGAVRPGTSLIFQDYGLLPWETVQGNAELGLEARGLPRPERRSLVRPILRELGLDEFSGLYPARLSGGMRQRVAVARALASHSDLLLMDEPFSSLDALTREALQDNLLETQAKHGTTIVLVTHSIEEAAYLADTVYILEGRNPARLSEPIRTRRGAARAGSGVPGAGEASDPDRSRVDGGRGAGRPPADGSSGPTRSYRESPEYFADLADLRRRFFSEAPGGEAAPPKTEEAPFARTGLASFASRLAKTTGAALAVVLAWGLLSLLVDKPFLPGPALVLGRFAQGLGGGLPGHILASLRRVFGALLLAAPPAWFLGLAAGRLPIADALASPLVYLLHPLPKVAFLPVLMLFLGLGDASKLALMGLVIFGQLFVGARDSAKAIAPALLDTVRSLGGRRGFLLRKVVLPSTLPALLSSLRVSLGTAIAVLFLSETFASMDGLGWYIMDAWSRVDYPDMYAAILALSLLGLALYFLIDGLEALLLRWRES